MKILTESESKLLYFRLKASLDPRDIFLQILFETGARVSESLHLSPGNLVGDELTIEPLKGSNLRRVKISPNLQAKLKRFNQGPWIQQLSTDATLKSVRRGLTRHWHATSSRLLGRRLNLHILRHTAFSRLYSATKDLLMVKQWAGHRSINSTMKYMQLDQMSEANDASQELLKGFGT